MNNMLTTEQFAYWLQGFFEINNPKEITEEQTKMIKDHLNMVFNKIDFDNPPVRLTGKEILNC